jgi:hypothetical protein
MEEFSESFSHKFKPEQIYTNTQSQMIRHTFVKIQTDLFWNTCNVNKVLRMIKSYKSKKERRYTGQKKIRQKRQTLVQIIRSSIQFLSLTKINLILRDKVLYSICIRN